MAIDGGATLSMIESLRQSISQRWQELSARDQRALIIGSGVIAVLLLGALVWSRVETHQLRAERLNDKSRQLAELSQRFSIGTTQARRAIDHTRVSAAIEQAVRGVGWSMPLIRDGAGHWYVDLDNVPLAQVIELERRLAAQGIFVARYALERAAAVGVVSGRLEWRTDLS